MPPTFPITVTTPLGNYRAQGSGVASGIGPYVKDASIRYLFYTGLNSVQVVNTLAILKSTDAGLTWTAMDEEHAPAFDDNGDNSTSCFDGSRYINGFFMETTNINQGIVNAVRFDTQTDTWGSVVVGPTSGAGGNLDIMCCWVSTLSQAAVVWDDDGDNSRYQLYDPSAQSFGGTSIIPRLPTTGGNVVQQIIEGAGGILHYFTIEFGDPVNTSHLVFCSVDSNSSAFATPQDIGSVGFAGVGLNGSMVYDSATGLLTMAWQNTNAADPAVNKIINVIQGTSQFEVAFSNLTTVLSPVTITVYNAVGIGLTQGSQLALFWADDNGTFYYSQSFAAPTVLGTSPLSNNIDVSGFVPATSLTGYALAWSRVGYWELEIAPPPPPVIVPISTPYGSKGPVAPPNDYTMCLVREFHLFKAIEFSKLECCPGRECIITDYVEAVGIGYEETSDGLAFNPVNAIPLPAPTDGEVVVLSEVVPIGYDGMLLAQFHGYIQSPSGTSLSSFTEGSGDIAWRITSNDRYLKDCGNMLVSIGSTQRLSPIYGGIRVRSGDTITYRVQVYNLSGLLTPGLGSIIAGLHGFFYPRK